MSRTFCLEYHKRPFTSISVHKSRQRFLYLNGSDSRWWLSDDGWVEQSHQIYTFNSADGGTNVATDDVFANTPFCVGQTTYVYDTQNTAEGFGDGSVGGVISNAYAAGGCSALLHLN
jgi:hypothetical protein